MPTDVYTPHDLEQAMRIRTSLFGSNESISNDLPVFTNDSILDLSDEPRVVTDRSEWFIANSTSHIIPYTAISAHSDEEYMKWRNPSSRIHHKTDMDASIREWVGKISDTELASVLGKAPKGLGAHPDTGESFDFTPWQRLSMCLYVDPPFPVTSLVKIDTATLRALAEYATNSRSGRQMPIRCHMSVRGTRDLVIVDLPTSAGKTSWIIATSLMLITESYERLLTEFVGRSIGIPIMGSTTNVTARLAIIACGPSTFDHFVTTARRIVAQVTGRDVRIWTGSGSAHTVQAAAELPSDEAVIWILPLSKLTSVLRAHPNVIVPVCAMDEYTQDVPRERYIVDRSQVLKYMIANATPQAFTQATSGRSILSEYFGGAIVPPRRIAGLVRSRQFNAATQACRQLCLLDLVTLTPFRDHVRRDLGHLIPKGVLVTFVKSKRVTMASHLNDSASDLVPASFRNVLLKYLVNFSLTSDSRERLDTILESGPIAISDFVTALEGLTSIREGTTVNIYMERLISRVNEFSEGCPICMAETSDTNELRLCGCCGYCVCSDCHDRATMRKRCPFCRCDVTSNIERLDALCENERQRVEEERLRTIYPDSTVPFDPPSMRNNEQIANLTLSLRHLIAPGARLLLIIETSMRTWSHGVELERRLGADFVRVDDLMTGMGTQFASVKRRFDSPDPRPICLVSLGMNDHFLVGTDLAHATGIIVVGNISERIFTQAMGRVLRARRGRDNTQPIQMIRIYS